MYLIVDVLHFLGTVAFWAAAVIAALLLLRVAASWAGVNPFGRVSYNLTRLTEPLVRPLRYQFGSRSMRYDLLPLVVAVMVLVTGLFVSSTLSQFAIIIDQIWMTAQHGTLTVRFLLRQLIILIGTLYVLAILCRFLLPFFGFGYGSSLMRFIFGITEPLLKPLRRIFVAGMFDFSPLVAMILVQVITGILAAQLR